jgi:hypothetical protein
MGGENWKAVDNSGRLLPSKDSFGRFARLRNAFSASSARFLAAPALRETSREIAEGERPSSAAIDLALRPLASPGDGFPITKLRQPARRTLRRGSIPPWCSRYEKTVAGGFPISRLMSLIGMPRRHKDQIQIFRSSVIAPCIETTTHLLS